MADSPYPVITEIKETQAFLGVVIDTAQTFSFKRGTLFKVRVQSRLVATDPRYSFELTMKGGAGSIYNLSHSSNDFIIHEAIDSNGTLLTHTRTADSSAGTTTFTVVTTALDVGSASRTYTFIFSLSPNTLPTIRRSAGAAAATETIVQTISYIVS